MTLRAGLAVAALLAPLTLGGCDKPSPLSLTLAEAVDQHDEGSASLPAATGDDVEAWRQIARRARGLDGDSADLDAAIVGFDRDHPGDLRARTISLEVWAAQGGRINIVPAMRATEQADIALAIGALGLAVLDASAADDRALEAALYLADRLRRDGNDMMSALMAAAITHKAAIRRPHPPGFASSYAPSDDEVIRAFAAEAMSVSRMVAWMQSDDAGRVRRPGSATSYRDGAREQLRAGDPLADWTFLADAPKDRAGFTALLAKRAAAAGAGDVAGELPTYAKKLFDSVDEYLRWLKSPG